MGIREELSEHFGDDLLFADIVFIPVDLLHNIIHSGDF